MPRRLLGRSWLEVVLYGAALGVLLLVLELTGYRFLVLERSVQAWGSLVAALFAAVGIALGLTLRRPAPPPEVVVREVPVSPAQSFERDEARRAELAITPRELEILELIAAGLSNREIGERLFVSENTVKTHASRVFDKLGARRRTQAVQVAKAARLIP